MTEQLYLINRNADGTSVLHLEHGDERCNRDDMDGHTVVDAKTGAALAEAGDIARCAYCFPQEDPS